MEFASITLQDFRNIPFAKLSLEGNRHFFLGPNGQGKSNLLEALGLVTALRSFRTRDFRVLSKQGTQGFSTLTDLRLANGSTSRLEIRVHGATKRLILDGEVLPRLGDLLGAFPTVVMSSADLLLLRGAPSERRRWLDLVLSTTAREYFAALSAYAKALTGRNRLLKARSSSAELASFEAAMAEPALEIGAARAQAMQRLSEYFEVAYRDLSEGVESVELSYRNCLEGMGTEDLQGRWRSERPRDAVVGSTQFGPHRDDVSLRIDRKRARDYGSDGQQRGLVLAMRIAQARYLEEKLKKTPILLADDVLGELDPQRRKAFWKNCRPGHQIIATGTEPPPKAEDWTVWKVEEGTFQRIE